MPGEHLRQLNESSWENRAVYQIYPRSFNEVRENPADLRGEGNIQGMTEQLDYLHDLGVGAVWISPFYPSPMVDGGYDVSDYCNVDIHYGNLDEFDVFVNEAHERDIKVMIDLVFNHTSDQHEWFKESRSSHDNPHSNHYIWRDPERDGQPPNNWGSVFSLPQLRARQAGKMPNLRDDEQTPSISAWKFDETREQYYLHTFAEQQPDLNWENPQVREDIKNVMRFWLDRKVDGFRVDAVNHAAKNVLLPDEMPNPNYREGVDNPYDKNVRFQSAGHPSTLQPYLTEMISVLDEYPDQNPRIIFEAYVNNETIHMIDGIAPEKASSFYFGRLKNSPWDAQLHKHLIDEQFATLPEGGIANHVNGNHDKPRLATRLGDASARTAALINLTLPGMPFIYQGEEGGFKNVEVPPERRDDKLGERDGVRTPMLWTPDKNAGFSDIDSEKLWLPIAPDYETINLETQQGDPRSSFSLYKTLLSMRKHTPALRKGTYTPLRADHPDTLAYALRTSSEQVTVLANFSDHEVKAGIWGGEQAIGRIVLSSIFGSANREVLLEENISLLPNESVVIVGSA